MTLTFLLDYQQISRTDKSVVVAGSVNYLRAKFSPKSDDRKASVGLRVIKEIREIGAIRGTKATRARRARKGPLAPLVKPAL